MPDVNEDEDTEEYVEQASAPQAAREPLLDSWNDTTPRCPICGGRLPEHWRGRPCLESSAPPAGADCEGAKRPPPGPGESRRCVDSECCEPTDEMEHCGKPTSPIFVCQTCGEWLYECEDRCLAGVHRELAAAKDALHRQSESYEQVLLDTEGEYRELLAAARERAERHAQQASDWQARAEKLADEVRAGMAREATILAERGKLADQNS